MFVFPSHSFCFHKIQSNLRFLVLDDLSSLFPFSSSVSTYMCHCICSHHHQLKTDLSSVPLNFHCSLILLRISHCSTESLLDFRSLLSTVFLGSMPHCSLSVWIRPSYASPSLWRWNSCKVLLSPCLLCAPFLDLALSCSLLGKNHVCSLVPPPLQEANAVKIVFTQTGSLKVFAEQVHSEELWK